MGGGAGLFAACGETVRSSSSFDSHFLYEEVGWRESANGEWVGTKTRKSSKLSRSCERRLDSRLLNISSFITLQRFLHLFFASRTK